MYVPFSVLACMWVRVPFPRVEHFRGESDFSLDVIHCRRAENPLETAGKRLNFLNVKTGKWHAVQQPGERQVEARREGPMQTNTEEKKWRCNNAFTGQYFH